ncbi:MAG: hypothetical protein P8Y83_11840, partial [Gammaproteobacteria bacterium]
MTTQLFTDFTHTSEELCIRIIPVCIILTGKGSDAAIQALSTGAIDCILKPSDGYDQRLSEDICERVFQAACTTTVQTGHN